MDIDTATDFCNYAGRFRYEYSDHCIVRRTPESPTNFPLCDGREMVELKTHAGPRFMEQRFIDSVFPQYQAWLETPPSRPLAGAFSLAAGLVGFVVAMAAAI